MNQHSETVITPPGSVLRVLAIPGNDDCQTILPALDDLERKGLVENLHQRAAGLGPYTLVGLAFPEENALVGAGFRPSGRLPGSVE